MKILSTLLVISTLLIADTYGQSTYHFEKSFIVAFPDGVADQVCNIVLPDENLAGVIEVAISGGFTNQLTIGVIKKRISLIRNLSGYINQRTEVLDASGPMATQWAVGDYVTTDNLIPIYHLASTGNTISIKVSGQVNRSGLADAMQSGISVTAPIVAAHSQTRQYKSIMQDRVGIGTATPTERLSVNGNIRAKEIKVETANWPDYVFQEDYDLISLGDLEAYIKENGHLPGIPTANEVESEGVALAEMNRKLLEKVEELTLYIIDLRKELDQVKKKNKGCN